MPTKITRRQFLTGAAVGIGVTALACGVLPPVVTRSPVDAYFRKLAANRNPMNPTVLVAYASIAGSTMEIARAIAIELDKRGFTVDICPVKRVTKVKDYSHVVIGSAIRMSSPLPVATELIEEHRATLRNIPIAFFAVYLSNTGNDEASRKARLAYLDPIRNLVRLQNEAFFTGVYDPAKVSIMDGLLGKMMQSPVGDFRDWAAISSWGQSIFAGNNP